VPLLFEEPGRGGTVDTAAHCQDDAGHGTVVSKKTRESHCANAAHSKCRGGMVRVPRGSAMETHPWVDESVREFPTRTNGLIPFRSGVALGCLNR
jgi:hypothetical protein